MANYDLNKHKKSDKIKWVFTGIAFVLVFVFLAGLCMQLFAKDDKYKPSEWFKKDDTEQTPTTTPSVGMVTPLEIQGNGIKLTSAVIAPDNFANYEIAPQAESAQTVTAVITPDNATNQKVDYTASWADASSSWAKSRTVTDYVTVSQSTDGSLTAVVTCLQVFCAQINLTVTSRDNSEITATLPIDYVRRVVSSDVELLYSDDIWRSTMGFTFHNTYSSRFSVKTSTYADGTVSPDISCTNFKVGFEEDELDLHGLREYYKGEYNLEPPGPYTTSFAYLSNLTPENLFSCSTAVFYENFTNGQHKTTPHCMYVSCDYTLKYNGVTYGSGTVKSNCYLNVDNLKVSVSDINFGENNRVFF